MNEEKIKKDNIIFFLIDESNKYNETKSFIENIYIQKNEDNNFTYNFIKEDTEKRVWKKFLEIGIQNIKVKLKEDLSELNIGKTEKKIILENIISQIPNELRNSEKGNLLEYNKNVHKWIPYNIKIISFISDLKKRVERGMDLIYITYQEQEYRLNLSNQDDIKKLLKEIVENLKSMKDKNSKEFENLALKYNLLKENLNKLNEDIKLSEKYKKREEIINAIADLAPYGKKLLGSYKILKYGFNLISWSFNKEEEEESLSLQ